MIAVYYDTTATPFTIYVLKVTDADHQNFLDTLETTAHPFPSSDVVFIQNERVVHQWNPSTGV